VKKQIKIVPDTFVFTMIAALVFMFAASSIAFAQADHKVGDKVEVDDGGRWYKAEIIAAQDGKFRIHYDGYSPVMDVWVLPDRIRSIGGPDPSTINKATKYKPGDRVECDKASIGFWEKGTVVPFLPNDTNKNSGNFYRVRLDSKVYGYLYAAGHECNTVNIRPINEAPIKASGKYKVGDQIEARNANNSWLPGKVIAVEGAFYKVRFDNHDSRHDESVSDDRIRPYGTTEKEAATENAARNNPKPTPPAATTLPGSAWSLRLYRKSKGYSADGTVMTMLFCPNGTWDIVRTGLTPGNAGAVGQRGTYRVAGKRLTLKNGQDGTTESYSIAWLDAGTVELSDGSDVIWRLFDGVKSDCK